MIPTAAINIVIDLWPVILLCLLTTIGLKISISISKHKKIEIYKEIINLVFITYIILLFSLVTATDFSSFGNNFIPFKEIFRYKMTSKLFYRNVVGNMILFIPFGYFVSYYCKTKNISYSLILSLLISTTIESIQMLLGRCFDVDDIILNVLGGIIGYIIYVLGELIFKKTSEKFKNNILLNLICIVIIIILIIIILNLYGVFIWIITK